MATPQKTWWRPVWVGLVDAKHYERLGTALYLLLYLIFHADPHTGRCSYNHARARERTGISLRTLQRWFAVLRDEGYITVEATGRGVRATIRNWRLLGRVNAGGPGAPGPAAQPAKVGAVEKA